MDYSKIFDFLSFIGLLPKKSSMDKFRNILSLKRGSEPALLNAHRNHVICVQYYVTGENPSTGRRKKVTVVASVDGGVEEAQKNSGLLPPYEVNIVPPTPPTERQVQYAKSFGFSFPTDATIEDATVFLTRAEEDLPIVQPAAPDDVVRYVVNKGIYITAYAGTNEVSSKYLLQCPSTEKAAFFCMRVFCAIYHKNYRFLEDATPTEIELFSEFANLYSEDNDFMRSLNHYGADDLPLDRCIIPKRLKAYEIATAFLKVKGAGC